MSNLVRIVWLIVLTHSAFAFGEEKQIQALDTGLQYLIDNDYENAERLLKKASIEPGTMPEGLRYLGGLYLETGQYDLALEVGEKLLASRPANVEAMLIVARAHCKKAQESSMFRALKLGKKCVKQFDAAAKHDSKNPKAMFAAAEIFFGAPGIVGGSEKKGYHYLEQLSTVSPEHAKALKLTLAKNEGDDEAANAVALELFNSKMLFPQHQYHVARHFHMKKDYQKAKKLYDSLSRLNRDVENKWVVNDSLLQLGEIYIAEGKDIEAGISLVEQYKARNSNKFDRHYYWARWILATGYKAIGNSEQYQNLVKQIESEDYKRDKYFAKYFEENK